MGSRWAKALVAIAACAALAITQGTAFASARTAAPKPDPNGTVRLGQSGGTAIATFDTQKYPSGQVYYHLLTLVYDRLLQLSGDSKELRPMLATSWKWDSTGTQLTMSLRKGVKFQ